ncbi:MAG: hypothetical protein D6731_03065 [Planctomycetota bacterium]|nr:MAG: hypothetical protein D6731_03065 [Planctomycetota bacterium]
MTVELPELQQEIIDASTLERLLDDLAACAEDLEVLPKRGRHRPCEPGGSEWTLAATREALLCGELHGVQFRYRHQGQAWCDTVLPAPGGWRLTRMALGASSPPGTP